MQISQSPQDHFRLLLLTVAGQAFVAAGYALDDRPVQWAGGLIRFIKSREDGLNNIVEFQHLYYAEGGPSRFTVTLARTDQLNARAPSSHPQFVRRALSALVVADFGVPILPSPDHWWTYTDTTTLGNALGEAGSLTLAYGMPWLDGDLTPPTT